jgi:hypothetical protein
MNFHKIKCNFISFEIFIIASLHRVYVGNNLVWCMLVSRFIAFTLAKFQHGVIGGNRLISWVVFCVY